MTETQQIKQKWVAGIMLAMLVLSMGNGFAIPVYAEEDVPPPQEESATEPEQNETEVQSEPEIVTEESQTEEETPAAEEVPGEEGEEGIDGEPIVDETPAENGEDGGPSEPGNAGEDGDNGTTTPEQVPPQGDPGQISTGNGTSTAEVHTEANVVGVDTNAPSASSTPSGGEQSSGGGGGSTNINATQEVLGTTTATSATDTGNNTVSDHDESTQLTGNGLASVLVNELFNVVKVDSELQQVELFYNPGDYVINFLESVQAFFAPSATPAGEGCSVLGCVADTILNINQNANVNQVLVGDCNSGSGLGGLIGSGDCTTVVVTEQKANWVALNSNLMVLNMHHIGDVQADIMLPEPAFFENLRGGSVARGTDLSIEQNATSTCNGAAGADSGGNSTEWGTVSGDATGESNCVQMINQINPPSCFIVSVSGAWNGEIYQLPRGFEKQQTPFGTLICGRGTGASDPAAYSGVIKQDLQTVIDAVANSTTGDNTGNAAVTGNAVAIINALKVGNQVFMNEDWVLGVFTVAGDWNGDLLFGPRPLPTPAEQVAGEVISQSSKKRSVAKSVDAKVTLTKTSSVATIMSPDVVEYTITLKNNGGKIYKAVLEDILSNPEGAVMNTQSWNLGTVFPDEEIVVSYSVQFNGSLIPGDYTNAVRLSGKAGLGGGAASIKPVFTSTSLKLLGGEVLGAEECPAYLTGYITTYTKNDPEQVRLLEVFLRDGRGESVTPDGIYDALSVAAVKRFQAENVSDILAPWGIDYPTGQVYYTTRKKINELYCNNEKTFPLSPVQADHIELYRNGTLQGGPTGTVPTIYPWTAIDFPLIAEWNFFSPIAFEDSASTPSTPGFFSSSIVNTHPLLALLRDIFSQIALGFSIERAQAAQY